MHTMMRKYKKWISLFLTALMLFSLVNPRMAKAAGSDPITLAKWDFSNGNVTTPASGIPANLDKNISAVGSKVSGYNAGPSGNNVINANTWSNGTSYWVVSVSTKDYQNITLSSKQYSSATGPKDFKVQYSLDNSTWLDVPDGTVSTGNATWTTGGQLVGVSLPAETNDKDLVYVRWLVNSTLSAKGDGSAFVSGGTSRIGDIEFKGTSTGAPALEKTATPDATKIQYADYSTVTGDEGSVVGGSLVKLYNADNTVAGSTTAAADGSFAVTIANPKTQSAIYVTAQEDGKDPSAKATVTYTGKVIEKTATPLANKITYKSYTNVIGDPGAVAGNATINLYFDDNTVVTSGTANADGSFNLTFVNPQSKSTVNLTAQEDGKASSDKVAINFTGDDPNAAKPGDVVFSQIYVNGGNGGAFYNTKFFELYNNTNKDIDLSNWSIAYTSASTMNFGAGQALSGTIKAHGYFLVAGNKGTTGADLPVKADVDVGSKLNPSGSTGGGLVLANKKTAVSGVNDPNAIDLLAFTNGTASFANPLYWGSPISDSTIGGGTIQRKTNIGSDPGSAFGLGNGWFTKDPSKDFVMNKPAGANYPQEMVVHNSKFMLSPDASKITFTKDNGTTTIVGQKGAVPASATVKAYFENEGTLTDPKQATAQADGSFTLIFADTSNNAAVYLTHTDTTQPTPVESSYARINVTGSTDGVTSLSELRKNDANGLSLNIGYTTTIEGIATTGNTTAGNLKTNFFVQDDTGAINVINNLDPTTPIKAGDKYRITGQVIFTAGMTQFIPSSITNVGTASVPQSKQIEISSLNEAYESSLVAITGKVTNIPANGPVYDLTISDASNHLALVRIQGSVAGIEKGSTYTFIGTVGQYKKAAPYTSGYFVLPRSTSDIKGELSLTHTPIKKTYLDLDAKFKAIVKNADSVKLYFRGQNDTSYQSVDMETADRINYNGKILWKDVPQGKLFYYIEAKNSDETKYAGSANDPFPVDVIKDEDGPEFTNQLPENGSSVESRYPIISVDMEDPNGVNTSVAKISIDGTDFTSKATINESAVKLVLTREQSLTEGEHTVVVSAEDKLGNSNSTTWTFTVAKRFTGGNHYRGTTHNHTNISHDAAGSPEDALKAAEKYHYDFFAFSDHSHDIDAKLVNQDTVDHNGMKERTGGSDWQLTKDLAKDYTKDGKFVVFPAFEMTSTTWGHSNVFGTKNFIDRVVDGGTYQKLQNYYSWAITYDDIVAQFNHPAMSANAFDNFIPYDKKVDKLFTLLEVGNGSGAYSYANADSKFYSALDLGWHVAPTYGEDNHDATWGQTKKRTVIVAKDLTQDSLLDSMKNMRVYMSEDPNFTLDVSANGFYMGSTVDTNTLDFTISGSDPVLEKASDPDYSYIKTQSNDAIAKVELITNRGTVVQTYVPKDDSTSFTWNPDSITVAGGQQWFVVKVTQKDGDRIYSAPIWSPTKDLSVNVSDVSTTDGAIVGGVSANLKAGISNQGTINVSNITAHFYYDSIDSAHLIGDAQIDSLAANTSSSASVVWANPIPGTHNIIVTLSAKDHDLSDVKYSQSFMIKAPLNKLVMIDGSHNNENTKADAGTYKDNLKLFTTLMKQQGYTVAENSKTLSDQVLKDVAVLYITHPASAYTTDEITAIKNFVTNGGSLLMTEKSNFGGSNQNLNDILSGVGSSIAVNNDGVFDETSNGNFWSKPLDSNYSVRLHPTPVKNALTDFVPTIEYYSGSSLAKNDGNGNKVALTDSDTVTVLVRGNESTFQDSPTIKADSVSYNVATSKAKVGPALEDITGGSAIPLIASEDLGKGRVVVSGMNIFNDKQMDQTYNPKGNDPFAVNVVNWLSHLEPKISTIGDARKLTEGTNAVVEGTVTTTAFFDAAYIQDDTGGIMAFNDVPAGSLKIGDKVRIYGHIKIFENNFELEFGTFADSVVKLDSVTPIEPKVVSTKDSNAEENQGLLVKVKGKVVSKYDDNSYVINDGSGDTLVFTDGYIVNQSGVQVPKLKVGDTLEAVGLAGKFGEGNRIRVRDSRELIGTEVKYPIVSGVENNGFYNNDVVITFDEGTATLNGEVFTSGTEVSKEGTYTLVVTNQDGNETNVKFTIDKTAPKVRGVENNGLYNHDVTITFDKGSAKLDGKDFTSESMVTEEGSHTLIVTDLAGNTTKVTFIIDKTAPTVKGVEDGFYNDSVTISFDEGTATLNNEAFLSGTTVSDEGSYTLVVTDKAGNSTVVNFTIDKTVPSVIGVANDSYYNHDVTITFDKGTATLNGVAFESGNVVSKEGTYDLVVTDKAGNVTMAHFTIDKTAPVVTGVENNGHYNHEVTVSFNELGGILNDKEVPSGTKVSDEGTYKLVVTDLAGNVTTVVFTIDKKAPVVTGVSNNGLYNKDVTISFNKGTAKLNGKAVTNKTVVKTEGTYTLEVVDAAGNKTVVKFTIDKTAPSTPKINQVSDKSTTVSGKTEANATVTLYVAGKKLKTTVADKYGNYSFTISKQKAGTEIKVTATDKAGNVSKAAVVKVVDKTAPSTPKVDKVTVKSTKVTGKAEAGSKVVVKVGNKVIGTATVDKYGKFSVKIAKQKAGKVLTVTATDKAKNVSKAAKVTVKK